MNYNVTVSTGTTVSTTYSPVVTSVTVSGLIGPKGDTGTAATVAVGTVTTGAAGSSAVVANSGTSGAAVLDFTIPKGDKGETGNTGNTGPANSLTVPIGGVTTGAAGTSASATITGTPPNQNLYLTIPRGDKGDTGAQGDWSAAQPNRKWSASPNAGTLVSSDAGKLIFLDSATAVSVTSSLGFATGQRVDFLVTNSTVPSISAGTGATLTGTPLLAGGVVKFRAQYSAATLICADGATQAYILVGDLAAT